MKRLLNTSLQRNYYVLVVVEPCNYTQESVNLFIGLELQLLTFGDIFNCVLWILTD